MTPKKSVLGLVDTSRQVVRTPLIGVEFLHQRAMRAHDGVGIGAGLKAKDLIGLLRRHWATRHGTAPRCRVALRVLTPGGLPAVKIRCQ